MVWRAVAAMPFGSWSSIVGDQGVSCGGGEAAAAGGRERVVVEGGATVALELLRLRFHHRHHPLRPVAAGKR